MKIFRGTRFPRNFLGIYRGNSEEPGFGGSYMRIRVEIAREKRESAVNRKGEERSRRNRRGKRECGGEKWGRRSDST
ncbi:hypothetical protein YC2023_045781 [Brassica napus]